MTPRLRWVVLLTSLALVGVGACTSEAPSPAAPSAQRVRPRPSAPRSEPAAPRGATNPSSSAPVAAQPAERRRVVAIGDVHGDLEAGRSALRAAGLIDARGRWSGGDSVLVQVGDLLDRGDGERELMDLFESLREPAREAGGEVLLLLGNHEVMNAAGDLRYVTAAGLSQFERSPPHPTMETQIARAPSNTRGRLRAFLPGGEMALRLATYQLYGRVGDVVFAHGGLLPRHVDELERMAMRTAAWLRGEGRIPPEVVLAQDSPLWTRRYSASPTERDCEIARRALTSLGATRMVVAHTVQSHGIAAHCGGAVIAIDCGMSAHYGGPRQVLELVDGEVRILSEGQAPRTLALSPAAE